MSMVGPEQSYIPRAEFHAVWPTWLTFAEIDPRLPGCSLEKFLAKLKYVENIV